MSTVIADKPPTTTPRLVFFHVSGRRDLAQRAAAAAPGSRFATRRSWTADPGAPRRPLLGRGTPPVGLWCWKGEAAGFSEQARAVLLGLIHPLLAGELPCCFGFPFGPDVFAPRSLGVSDTASLDLEDIGRLLRVSRGQREDSAVARLPRRAGSAEDVPSMLSRASVPPTDGPRLDAAQRAAVEHGRGPARVLAPAGSGKTKTLVSRVAELVARGVDPSRILMLAFNRKAAEQLEERLAALGIATTRRIGAPPPSGRRRRSATAATPARGAQSRAGTVPHGVHCATFNAFGYRYQREVMGGRFTIDLDGRLLRPIMRQAMEAAGVSLAGLKPARGSDPVGAFLAGLTRVRAALEPPDQVEIAVASMGDVPLIQTPFAPVHAQYARLQAAAGRQSFDDQIYLAVADMLADIAHRAFIQARFDHVLVDEFQDLNGAQLALVDVLSRPSRDLFVVGDDDQLIYGWRHADPRGILEFHERMPPRPWSATYTLGTNYRCSRAVVECGARLVANNTVREAKDIRPRDGASAGAVRFAGAPSWPERAAAMCGFVRAERSRLACEWRDLAVLCRYRSQQLVAALALDADGVPRTPLLGYRLFTHPAAKLVRAYIDLVLRPDEAPGTDVALLLDRPNRYLGNAVVEAAGAASRPWAHVRTAAAIEPAAGPRPLSALVRQVERLGAELRAVARTDRGAEPPSGRSAEEPCPASPPLTAEQLVWSVVEEFGLEEHWDAEGRSARSGPSDPAHSGGERDGGGPLQVLDALALLAETYPDPRAYLRAWDRLRADEEEHAGMSDDTLAREEAEEDRVVIGTIHAAKGREYHAVVIPDYDCDVSRWEPAEIEEERRVVYVGVTRARDAALFTVDTSQAYVHPFLRELVEAPGPEAHASLTARLADQAPQSAEDRRRLHERLGEIEVLFPELVPHERAMVASGPDAPQDAAGRAPKRG